MAGGLWAAIIGYCFTFYNSQVQEQRKAQIERVNMQLSDLYGPLLACVTATKTAFDAMVSQHSPDGTREGFQAALAERPEGPEARAYRQWMTIVLQPLNEKAAAIVQGGFSLMEPSGALEAQLLQLVAHVSACRVILERWSDGDLRTTSAISYPDKLEKTVRSEFSRIKARQAELLGVAPLVKKKQWLHRQEQQHKKELEEHGPVRHLQQRKGHANNASPHHHTHHHTGRHHLGVLHQEHAGSVSSGDNHQITPTAILSKL